MRRCWCVLALLISVASARADTPPPLPEKPDRLVAVARVWAQAKFFHPTLATKDIDWDRALIAAIPKVEAATTVAQYKQAVDDMLAATRDPVTHVLDAVTSSPQSVAPPTEWLTWPSDGVLEVKLAAVATDAFDFVAIRSKGEQVVTEAAKAKALIIDLRGASNKSSDYAVEQLEPAFPAFDEWPTSRVVEHRGFRTQDGFSSGGYFSTFVTMGVAPPHIAPKQGPAHVVFVMDTKAFMPPYALALQAAGKATIVAVGSLRSDSGVLTTEVPLGAGLRAQIRLAEATWGPPTADITVAAGKDPMLRAREAAKHPARARKRVIKQPALLPLRVRDDLDYADAPLPSREMRLLAGIRLWAVIDQFLPYRYLIADWDGVLREMLPRLEKASDRDAYLRTLREMAVRAGDGHINVYPSGPGSPRNLPPIATRLIEGKLAVIKILDVEETKQLGLAIGDVIETIDGKPVTQVMADLRPITSGSTDEAREQRIASRVLAGDEGSNVKLVVRGANGKTREVTTTRSQRFSKLLWAPSTTPHWKKLPGNIGYADLRELTVPEVDVMFKELASTTALVLDMRGYPNGTAWSIAPHINVKHASYGAQFLMPLVQGGALEYRPDTRLRFLQSLRTLPDGEPLYTGKIVVLIDDRAISQAEHSCLFFQEAAGATFIGSTTHGANGDVTVMRLPGGLRMSFTGQEVRHVDGKQLQRVGIKPHITVRPTLAAIRAGKDEVLDRALAFIAKGK
ncbi:MAG TPA: S41 family peptidase [Kofleriaceae bacterium]